MDIDVSFFFQLAIFLTALIIGAQLLFKPFLKTLEQREMKIDGASANAGDLNQQAQEHEEQYATRLRDERTLIFKEREDQLNQIKMESHELLQNARQEALQELEQGRSNIRDSIDAAQQEMNTRVKDVALDIASRLLGRRL